VIHPGSVRATVLVDVDPDTAFEVFTVETSAWYRHGTLRFDGERVVGDKGEVGRITVWEPGHRLVFLDHLGTEVDVRFEPVDGQTRVVLEHRGLDRLDPAVAESVAQYGWRRLAFQFEAHLTKGEQR
jgi:hypothetical protein